MFNEYEWQSTLCLKSNVMLKQNHYQIYAQCLEKSKCLRHFKQVRIWMYYALMEIMNFDINV